MKLPGITIAPLVDLTGRHTFNQLFFEDVRVPRDCLVGEENRGWYVAAATLDFERSGINRVVAGVRVFEELVDYARETRVSNERPEMRAKLAELAIELTTGRMLSYRVASMQARSQIPNAEASMSKMYGSELQQRIAGTGMQLLGLGGQLENGRWAPLAGRLEQYYLSTSALTVAAGTTEIQKNIIAGRGLGLPRD
jgi:alkylation response protein AidB-like acyl-CoA dehydrogenase